MEKELEEAMQLSPQERMRRLKEIEQRRKNEIDDAHRLLQQAETELEEKDKLPIPELRSMDTSTLFGETDRQMFRMKQFTSEKKAEPKTQGKKTETGLEDTVIEEARQLTPEQLARQQEYQIELAQQPTAVLYDMAKELYQEVSSQGGHPDQYQMAQAYNLEKAREMKTEAIDRGEYTASEKARKQLDITDEISRKIVLTYRRSDQ
jgi:hypothetical protein